MFEKEDMRQQFLLQKEKRLMITKNCEKAEFGVSEVNRDGNLTRTYQNLDEPRKFGPGLIYTTV